VSRQQPGAWRARPWLALILLCTLAWLGSCAAPPRPRIMAKLDAVRDGRAVQEAKRLAPQNHAHAETLRQQAEQARLDDDTAGAQILSEQALAAYQHAFVLARAAKAQRRLVLARARLTEAQEELAGLNEQQQRVTAEAESLQLRSKVIRDAVPLLPNQASTPERESARLAAARSLAVQARLLCAATGLLAPDAKELGELVGKIAQLDQQLASHPSAVPIDEAIGLRSRCLRQLTLARRPATRQAPAAGRTDQLLTELSRPGNLFPFRDDRGVVVTLRGVVTARTTLTGAGAEALALLGRIAGAHPDFPVLVVIHTARDNSGAKEAATAEVVSRALTEAGAPKVDTEVAGGSQPLVEPSRPGASDHNARIEVVFVAPAL
jgi:hypothetical protein